MRIKVLSFSSGFISELRFVSGSIRMLKDKTRQNKTKQNTP